MEHLVERTTAMSTASTIEKAHERIQKAAQQLRAMAWIIPISEVIMPQMGLLCSYCHRHRLQTGLHQIVYV